MLHNLFEMKKPNPTIDQAVESESGRQMIDAMSAECGVTSDAVTNLIRFSNHSKGVINLPLIAQNGLVELGFMGRAAITHKGHNLLYPFYEFASQLRLDRDVALHADMHQDRPRG